MNAPTLPDPRTRLLGRDVEVAQLTELLRGTNGRIVAVVGAGGCGKTRLAIEVARRAAPSFRDGWAFVSLADVVDPGLVVAEIVRALGFVETPRVEPVERLIAGLRSLRLLVVLDGFEHLVAAAPMISHVAAQCPDVALLVTSRRRLNVTGERTLPLAPLADDAAIELFCERATAANPQFRASGSDVHSVGEICRLVDRLPLAIELVAPRVRRFSPDALLARLQRNDDALMMIDADVDTDRRHRSLWDTIGWSYDLLGPDAARLLPRLGVFRDGWTMAAMEAVCCDDDLSDDVAFEALVELVDMHLVALVDARSGEPRFRLLQTVGRFAVRSLRHTGTEETILERHATHFVELAIRAGEQFESPHERPSAALVDQELPNIRAALEHRSTVDRPGAGLAAATALGPYWLDWGPLREGRDWIDWFLTSSGGSTELRAVAEGWSVRFAVEMGETAGSYERLVRARAGVDGTENLAVWLGLTDHLATSLRLQGLFDLADEYLVDALERCRTPDTAWVQAELLLSRAVVARDRGDPGRVGELVAEATRVARLAGHERVQARAMMNLALSDPTMHDARAEVERAFQLCRDVGDLRSAAMSAAVAAVLAHDDGDPTGAATWFLACLDVGVTVGCWHAVAWGVTGVAGLAVRCEHIAEAARLYRAMRPHLDVVRQQTPPAWLIRYDGVIKALRERLGADFESDGDRGEARTWPAAVDLARRIAADLSRHESPLPAPATHRRRGPRANPELTDRELDVLRELVVGRTNQHIADRLGLSPKTVMHHTGSVYRKLGVRGRAEAVAHALREQLVAS